MSSKTHILKDIPKGKPVRILLPILQKLERIRAQCVYQDPDPPRFSLVFKPGILPIDKIDVSQPCIISIDMGGPTLSIEAMITEVSNLQTLQMIVRKTTSHKQMRAFFRVDAVTSVISKSFDTGPFNEQNLQWSTAGQTVDISGNGILAIFSEKPQADKQVHLEITIPNPEAEVLTVLAHEVRSQKLHDGRFEVAYHFDGITTEDRDKIIGCCLVIQRKMLRLKVQEKDS